MKLDFCSVCSRLVLRGFSYCPYCGTPLRAGPSLEDALGPAFERLEGAQAGFRGRRIDELLAEAEALEAELDELARALSPAARDPAAAAPEPADPPPATRPPLPR